MMLCGVVSVWISGLRLGTHTLATALTLTVSSNVT